MTPLADFFTQNVLTYITCINPPFADFFNQYQYYTYCMHYLLFFIWNSVLPYYTYYMHYQLCLFLNFRFGITTLHITHILYITPYAEFFTQINITLQYYINYINYMH